LACLLKNLIRIFVSFGLALPISWERGKVTAAWAFERFPSSQWGLRLYRDRPWLARRNA
jgi:hypothetical protein